MVTLVMGDVLLNVVFKKSLVKTCDVCVVWEISLNRSKFCDTGQLYVIQHGESILRFRFVFSLTL